MHLPVNHLAVAKPHVAADAARHLLAVARFLHVEAAVVLLQLAVVKSAVVILADARLLQVVVVILRVTHAARPDASLC